MITNDTIVALATAPGMGAIGVIRLSGTQALSICQAVFKGKNLEAQASHTIHYGFIMDGEKTVDEVMVSLFRAPKSFTTEDVVEIACHGSPFIQEQIQHVLIQQGARLANPGEFTLRAFLNGRIDLSQAEAVADLIASDSAAAHDIALKQMRGGFSNQIKDLREQLVNFASYIELELDFSEEDVVFADRTKLVDLITRIQAYLKPLMESFKLGNVIKNGVPVAIAGKPNAGKSTLLNALLNEERAIVSDIAGTTRDTIEEVIVIDGVAFRFIDTAGLRETADTVEKIGVQRSYEKIKTATVLLYITDAGTIRTESDLTAEMQAAESFELPYLVVANKSDLCTAPIQAELKETKNVLLVSAKKNTGVSELKQFLSHLILSEKVKSADHTVTNIRHYQALQNAFIALDQVLLGIDDNITTDLIAFELKNALNYLGQISGEVTNDEILGNIFSKFCIGK